MIVRIQGGNMKKKNEKMEKNEKQKNRGIILFLFILTLIASGFAIYNIFKLSSICIEPK